MLLMQFMRQEQDMVFMAEEQQWEDVFMMTMEQHKFTWLMETMGYINCKE